MASPSVSSKEPWTYSVYVGAELKLADISLFEAKRLAAKLASAVNRPAWLTVVSGEYVPLG
jgi:hypothetical protein